MKTLENNLRSIDQSETQKRQAIYNTIQLLTLIFVAIRIYQPEKIILFFEG